MADLEQVVASARVDDDVLALRPDYRVLLLAVDGIEPAAGDQHSERLLVAAEESARAALAAGPVEELPHVASWREAYRAFGAKPQRTRNSVEALLRRAAATGLPRVNRLTDIYNAVSVLHRVPLGGEDLAHYVGAPRLRRAAGDEPFETTASGEPVVEHPDPGEVVWCDDTGVTCRRWNWRQTTRTQLTDRTTSALFILDALDPVSGPVLETVADDLVGHLRALGADVRVARRLLAGPSPSAAASTTSEGA
jgi:DNA/RNA-binding domain of Phe-tRNA-synthetase-like protein